MLIVDTQWLWACIVSLFGLLIGSFLNVVIYRLPKMLEQQWAAECAEISGRKQTAQEPFNLARPRSCCPHCGHAIQWYENVPVVSYLFLRGRCSACKAPISLRYPAVEIVTSALFFFCAWRWGPTTPGLVWCTFSAALLALAFIDWDTTLLPDDITLPLLWLGLIAAAMRVCDQHNDSEAAREEMRHECLRLPPHLQQDLLDHFTGKPANHEKTP